MIDVIEKIITNILIAIYEPLGLSILMAVLFAIVFLYTKENGLKVIIKKWIQEFKSNSFFRCFFGLCFVGAMLVHQTLINRNMWVNPLSHIWGEWGIYNEHGDLITNAIETSVLFVPLIIFLYCCFKERIFTKKINVVNVLFKSVFLAFTISLSIELLQLFLRIALFQVSDLAYNTIGGTIGGLLYWLGYRIRYGFKDNKVLKEEADNE